MKCGNRILFYPEARAVLVEIRGVFLSIAEPMLVLTLPDFSRHAPQKLVVNISPIKMLTSQGIRNLFMLKESAEKEGLSFHLICDNDHIMGILSDLRLVDIFHIVRHIRELH